MWLLKLKGGIELTEAQVRYWDNVPQDVQIEAMALAIQRNGAAPYVIELRGYDDYCCARVAAGGMSGPIALAGYALYGSRGGQVTELEVLPSGMRLKSYERGLCELPDRCWRRGIS